MPLNFATQRVVAAKLAGLRSKTLSLDTKVRMLAATPSDDPLQQLQSDTIADLYAALVALQDITGPPVQALLPNVSGARAAAQAAQVNSGVGNTLPPPQLRR